MARRGKRQQCSVMVDYVHTFLGKLAHTMTPKLESNVHCRLLTGNTTRFMMGHCVIIPKRSETAVNKVLKVRLSCSSVQAGPQGVGRQ